MTPQDRSRLTRLLCGSALLLATLTGVYGQADIQPGSRRFTVEHGLSQGTINSVIQDHQGFIWVGTQDGLNRFDGIEFKIYRHDPGDSTSLSDSWITSIHEDGDHVLWIGTLRGLNSFDRGTETFNRYPLPDGGGGKTLDYPVTVIHSTRGSSPPTLLVGARTLCVLDRPGGGLVPFVPEDLHGKPPPPISPSAMVEDQAGGLWLGSGNLIYRLDLPTRRLDPVLELDQRTISSMFAEAGDAHGAIWIGATGGLYRYDPATGDTILFHRISQARAILRDAAGDFWVAAANGLWRIEAGVRGLPESHIIGGIPSASTGSSGRYILALCRDSSGALWFGTHDGLNRLNPAAPAFTIYRNVRGNPNSLGSNFVMPMLEDRRGDIWFGTFDRGISVLRGGGRGDDRFSHYRRDGEGAERSCGNNVRSMLETRDGAIWMGTDGGLARYDGRRGRVDCYSRVRSADTLMYWVDALYETRDGTLWAGATPARLVKIDRPAADAEPTFTPFSLMSEETKTPSGGVNVIVESRSGTLWAGTEAGLFSFDPRTGATRRYLHDPEVPEGLSNSAVWSLFLDTMAGGEILWVGTSQGLNRFDPASGEWKQYLRQEGFPSDWVYGILRDDIGRLWLSTNQGIACFDDRSPGGRKFKYYDITDGIAGNECNRRSYLRLRNGDFMFGGTNGVTRFNPLRLSDNGFLPPVVLTGFTKFGRKAAVEGDIADLREIRLGHDENVFSFEFAALDYANASKNQYAYRLDGFDRDWIQIGNRRYAGYTDLEPGEYVFRVKASNNDGLWNEEGIAVSIVIAPPLWATWWFRGGAFGLIVLAVMAVVRARERRAGEFAEMRMRIARDLHDEIGSNLTGIAVSGSLLKDAGALTPEQDRRVTDITTTAIRTSELMRDLVWMIRPENDRLDDLCFRMKDVAAGILGGVRCTFRMPDDPSGTVLNLEVKRHLYLMYKEILTNIARHAGAKEVDISLEVSGKVLTLAVADDGAGFDGGTVAGGMGLKNISARAAAAGGSVEMKSAPGAGTRITVSIPIT